MQRFYPGWTSYTQTLFAHLYVFTADGKDGHGQKTDDKTHADKKRVLSQKKITKDFIEGIAKESHMVSGC